MVRHAERAYSLSFVVDTLRPVRVRSFTVPGEAFSFGNVGHISRVVSVLQAASTFARPDARTGVTLTQGVTLKKSSTFFQA